MDLERLTAQNQSMSTNAPAWFATTQWSVVMLAAQVDSLQAIPALEKLCRSYWLPLYSYIRRRGYSPADAQDLTQGFFERLLRLDSLATVGQAKGKFRTFLLNALLHFLSDERDRAQAEKRGGGQVTISLDDSKAEEMYLEVPSPNSSPEQLFDRRWALTVLEKALARLREDYVDSGRGELFEQLRTFLSTESLPGDYDALAPKLGMTPRALGVAVHRLRQRYRECIRLELAQTVATPEDLDQEMNYLLEVLGG
jgi:RNA polymerase sigma-70 factor (ECF subfamily)